MVELAELRARPLATCLARRGVSRLAGSIDVAEGIELSARLLDADPLDEAALRPHMAWLARGGQSARARQAYHEFVRRLSDDLGLTPGAELRALHDSLGTWRGPPRLLHRPQQSIKTSSVVRSNCAGSAHCWRRTTAS